MQRALALDPTNVAVHLWFALHLGADGEFESALAAVTKAEEMGAVKFAALNGGMIHFAQGDTLGAVQRWNRYFETQGIRTRAPQLLVEAVADPRRRPAALTVIDALPPDEFVFYSNHRARRRGPSAPGRRELETRHGRDEQRHLVGRGPAYASDR